MPLHSGRNRGHGIGLWSKVAQLPDGQRQTLVLRFSEGLRYEEIADVLGCPLGTVKSRIHNGLLRLRQIVIPLARLRTRRRFPR